ncbi:fgf-1 [Clostera anachoreta granulovirus]|uniref:Fgf-1 n=1 Tax=Clostera anachoreta granulovirus TaxID=283675 RepID=F4ZKT9_9BBAC|nr:fgf-1 [Clostera anachoreta granulovirus]AEB00350.1 fgf-1 [Clostera anachoreta granulovirus]
MSSFISWLTLLWWTSLTCGTGTLGPLNRRNYRFCMQDDVVQIRSHEDTRCKKIEFNVHARNGHLILNFVHADLTCRYLCVDRCGNVYHDSVYRADDCAFTTAAFDHVDTLSIHRGNYSDFLAVDAYYTVPVSMTNGASMERLYNYLALVYNNASSTVTCNVTTKLSNSVRQCDVSMQRRAEMMYMGRKHHDDYSFWERVLNFFGIKKFVVPDTNVSLSYAEYQATR